MNVILAAFRRLSLGGVIFLVISIIKRGTFPNGQLGMLFLVTPVLYLIFVFFSWLSAKRTTRKLSEQIGMDVPSNGYFKTLLRSCAIDIVSPIGVIIDLFKDSKNKVIMFILTYLVILLYLAMWFVAQ